MLQHFGNEIVRGKAGIITMNAPILEFVDFYIRLLKNKQNALENIDFFELSL